MRLADVEPEEVEWLWYPYIPRGKLVLIEGDPGQGKTFLALALAAAVSRGWSLPDQGGKLTAPVEPGPVVYVTAEDGLGDTIRPRLDAMGADVARILAIDGATTSDGRLAEVTLKDVELLEQVLVEHRPSLLIIDPLQAFLGANIDMHRANEVRPVLTGVARIAAAHRVTALAIRHLRKSNEGRAVHRGLGSIDFSAAVRGILAVGMDPDDEGRRLIAHAKSNLGPRGTTLGFTLDDGQFRWAGTSDLDADSLFQVPASEKKSDQAEALLNDLLTGGEEVEVDHIKRAAENRGISWRTVERAQKRLGVQKRKTGFVGPWVWWLPAADPTPPDGGLQGDGPRPPTNNPEEDAGLRGGETEVLI